jgi:FdhD protein
MTDFDFSESTEQASPTRSRSIRRMLGEDFVDQLDQLIAEEPLEIILAWQEGGRMHRRPLSMTMRTPGADRELVVGFLFSEGIIEQFEDIALLKISQRNAAINGHVAEVVLRDGLVPEHSQIQRQALTNSSCGVCAKTSIDDLMSIGRDEAQSDFSLKIAISTLYQLNSLQRASQKSFDLTGGVHATSLFGADGKWVDTAEDVGRHNAFDKIIGRALMRHQIPLRDKIVVVSGRASYELVQKADRGGAKLLCAVGAPSSLAVEMASQAGISLVGFLRENRLNIYCHAERLM